MAKIVYGVSGEGSGHSSRARVMIKHLEKLGHAVKVVSYDRGYNNLKEAVAAEKSIPGINPQGKNGNIVSRC